MGVMNLYPDARGNRTVKTINNGDVKNVSKKPNK